MLSCNIAPEPGRRRRPWWSQQAAECVDIVAKEMGPHVNVEFVNPFLDALLNVLMTMAQTEAHRQSLGLKSDEVARGEVTGIIAMTGKQAKGSLAITFAAPAILDIFAKMMGEPKESVDKEVGDLVGELTNMVSGGARKTFSEKGLEFEMAIPAVIIGPGHTITHKTKGKVVLVTYQTTAGRFYVEICFE